MAINPRAKIYRFHDTVAVWLNGGITSYLTPQRAREIGEQLIAGADDVDKATFTNSRFGNKVWPETPYADLNDEVER